MASLYICTNCIFIYACTFVVVGGVTYPYVVSIPFDSPTTIVDGATVLLLLLMMIPPSRLFILSSKDSFPYETAAPKAPFTCNANAVNSSPRALALAIAA